MLAYVQASNIGCMIACLLAESLQDLRHEASLPVLFVVF